MRLGTDISEGQIWRVEYFRPAWQLVFDGFHSIPLALIGLVVMLKAKRTGVALLFVSIALHALEDLPVHHDDAHRHFLPFSNFRFISPVSYWDNDHFGAIAGSIEFILMITASLYLFSRVRSRWTKGLLIVANALPLLAHLWFSTTN